MFNSWRPASRDAIRQLLVVTSVVLGVGFLRGLPALLVARGGGLPPLWMAAGLLSAAAAVAGLAMASGAGDGPRRALTAAGLVVAVAWVGVQVAPAGSDAHFALASFGAASFVVTLATFVTGWPYQFAPGLFVGLGIDAAARVGLGSADLTWVDQPWTVAAATAAAALHVALVVKAGPFGRAVIDRRGALAVFALGPLLLIELQLLANQGWLAAAAQLTDERAAGAVVLGTAVAAAVTSGSWPVLRREGIVFGSVLLGALLVALSFTGSRSLVVVVVAAQVAAGRFLRALVAPSLAGSGYVARSFALGAGAVASAAAVGAYYGASSSVAGLGPAHVLGAIGAVFLVTGGLRGVAAAADSSSPWPRPAGVGLLVVAGLLAAGAVPIGPERRIGPARQGYPVRVATYNVHNGFSLQPDLNLPAVASALEAADADVVALQEVSRGRMIDGGVDALGWLQRRLGMPHVAFGPTTADGATGNAVLSRHALTEVGRVALPSTHTPRAALSVEVDLGAGQRLLVVTTHLESRDSRTRSRQTEVLLDAMDTRNDVVVLGDLNATADSRVIDLLAQRGLEAVSSGQTFPSSDPNRTLDWVAHSRDLAASGEDVVNTAASDHLPVVVTIDQRDGTRREQQAGRDPDPADRRLGHTRDARTRRCHSVR